MTITTFFFFFSLFLLYHIHIHTILSDPSCRNTYRVQAEGRPPAAD